MTTYMENWKVGEFKEGHGNVAELRKTRREVMENQWMVWLFHSWMKLKYWVSYMFR